jgi:hypothetical protein
MLGDGDELELTAAAPTPEDCDVEVSEELLGILEVEEDVDVALTRRAPHMPVTFDAVPTVLYNVHWPSGEPSAHETSTQSATASQSWMHNCRLNVFVG